MTDKPQTQLDKFKQAAKELEADEDDGRWDERLKKVAKQKPAPDKPHGA
jgi:hypothetical protein